MLSILAYILAFCIICEVCYVISYILSSRYKTWKYFYFFGFIIQTLIFISSISMQKYCPSDIRQIHSEEIVLGISYFTLISIYTFYICNKRQKK